MPDIDPAYYDAIDEVIEQRKDDSDWDPQEMRGALKAVAKGESQSAAAEECDFSQPLLSQRWSDVQEVVEQIRHAREGGSKLFKDPVKEAVDDFQAFFENLNEKYEFGISGRVIQMMVDEIQNTQQLPPAPYVDNILRSTKSGISGGDVDYVKRRYEQWLNGRDGGRAPGSGQNSGVATMGGQSIGQQQGGGQSFSGGVPIGGQQQQQQQMGGWGQQQQMPQQQMPQQQMHPNQMPRHQTPPPRDDGDAEDPRVDELQQQVEELTALVTEVMQEDDQPENIVTITQDDGSTIEMPFEQAVQMGYIGQDDGGDDFLEQLAKAKEAGLIPDEDDGSDEDDESLLEQITKLKEAGIIEDDSGSEMAEAVQQSISELGSKQLQAQQQMSQNFQQVVQEMRDMQEDDDGDFSAEDVEAIIEDKLTASETDRLRDEMNQKFSRMMDELETARRRGGDAAKDPDFLKKDREMEFREKQLETLNQNVKELPHAVASSVREGLVPMLKEVQYAQGEGGNPLFTPPGGGQRGEPGFVPDEVQGTEASQPEPQQPAQEASQAEQQGYPERQAAAEGPGQVDTDREDVEAPESVSPEDANEVRDKLGLSTNDDTQEAKA